LSGLAFTAYFTEPAPVSLAPDVREIQSGLFEAAVHAQSAVVVTTMVPFPAPALNVALVGATT
jgi:hypothetical protein